jgi:hypothetical protein
MAAVDRILHHPAAPQKSGEKLELPTRAAGIVDRIGAFREIVPAMKDLK